MTLTATFRMGFRTLVLCLGVFGCTDTFRSAPAETERVNVLDQRNIYALVPDAESLSELRIAAQSDGYQELDVARLDGIGLILLTFRIPEGVTGPEAIEALENAVPRSKVGVNHAYRLQAHLGADQSLEYADTLMNWPDEGCHAKMPVGMIDTAIDRAALNGSGTTVVTKSFVTDQPARSLHGTEVATLLTDPRRLQDVNLYAANVFGRSERAEPLAGVDALVRSIDWLASKDVRLVNLALAGPYNKLLDLAVEKATARGLILVAAVGNDGPRSDPQFPAGFDNVIAVTAVDAKMQVYEKAVRGPHVDVAAPGVDVLLTVNGRPQLLTGTSIATPFVTARLAADPSIAAARNVSQVRAQISRTSAELGQKGRDPVYGFGLALANDVCGE